ncbi:hypothetical protein BDL97_08G010500 [Sphagnum fallax]|nr:hypothetical protein BDL97_08G010500 [Sphagnum fallax]KAH8953184.1 hypothetical protein BDL97_08G010500 [Sphagnum fallax]
MSENTDVSAVAADALHGAVDNASDLPASTSAPSDRYVSAPRRLFNRDKSVHQLLGGGQVADVLLWRQKYLSISILVGSTVIWFLLEKSQYTLVALLSNILFFTVIILFVWANLAALLNRPGPPVHDLSLSEDVVLSTASALRVELNKVLEVVQDVARGKDFKLFLKVLSWHTLFRSSMISTRILLTTMCSEQVMRSKSITTNLVLQF